MIESITKRKRIITIILFLAISLMLVYQAIERPVEISPNADIEAYNNAVSVISNPDTDVNEKIDLFAYAKSLSKNESFVESYSNYNLAYLLLAGPYAKVENFNTVKTFFVDIEKLRTARNLLIEALRANPDDYDTQINLELVTRILVQEVKEQLVEGGASEKQAGDRAAKQEVGELPKPGEEGSRGSKNESDY